MVEKIKIGKDSEEWKNITELYQEKKKIGADAFNKLRNQFSKFIKENNEYIETHNMIYYPKRGTSENKLREMVDELMSFKDTILQEYEGKLQNLNNNISILEEKIGVEKLESDRDTMILKTEANFKGDDLAFRPIKEWYQPFIKKIKEILEN